MLLYLPFSVFLLSFIIVYKRNGFDLAACILLAYTTTSFSSILLAGAEMQYNASQLSFIPVVFHCFFTLALIYPFIKFNSNKRRSFTPIRNVRLFRAVSIVFIVIFFIQLIPSIPIVISRLRASDEELAALRAMAYAGELNEDVASGSLLHYLETILDIMGTGAMCMIVFFFYSICFHNNSKTFNVLLLISSMTSIIYSIITVDRSKLFFWILLFLMSFFLFKPYLPKTEKRFLFLLLSPVITLFLIYFINITVARFGETDLTAEGSILNYAGQPLFNVCLLWEKLPGNWVSLKGVFPLTYFLFDVLAGAELQFGVSIFQSADLSELNGFNALVGYGVREVGQVLTVILLIVLSLVMFLCIGSKSKSKYLSLSTVMVVFLLGTIVICGFISYYYSSWPHALMFWFFVFVTKKIS